MKAYQLIHAISKDLQHEITTHMATQHKAAFRMVMNTLAASRKLRPVFLQRKSRQEQQAWLLEQLQMKPNEGVAEQVIQLWLLKGQQGMLKAFLDAIGIEHKDGEVETLPEVISEETAQKGIAALLAEVPAEKAAVYLHMFQLQRQGGWEGLAKAVAAEPKLQLGAAA